MNLSICILCLANPATAPQDVAYERFQLDNGLTVILHEDHRQPQVAVNTWYWVGAKEEELGRSGFAHLFEHLMFRGTQRAPGSSFDDLMEAGGGWNNASTTQDRTNYYDIGPSELLPVLLWLEADRMQALGPSITQAILDNEREVVRNERRESYEDVPYGQAELEAQGLFYPDDHPYHIPVIGSHAELEAATVEDVHRFFERFYVPNNASLVVAGDFDPVATRELIVRLFSAVPRGNAVQHVSAEPVVLEQSEVHTLSDDVPFARTDLMWPSPAFLMEGDAEMDILAALLSGGVSTRLTQALVVERQWVESVDAYQSSAALGSEFVISALARPGIDLSEIEDVIRAELARLVEAGPSEDELERQKAIMEAATLQGLQSVEGKADLLNRYLFSFDEPNSFGRDLDRYRNASVESCQLWARKVFSGTHHMTLRVLPENHEQAEDPLAQMPELSPPAALTLPEPRILTLSNGIETQAWVQGELPIVELTVVLPFGSAQDPRGKEGLGHLAAQMLLEGAHERDAQEFSAALERLGAGLSAEVDRRETLLHLSVLGRNLRPALGLLADALMRPRFEPSDWARVRAAHLAQLRVAESDPNSQARVAGMQAFLGAGHPYSHSPFGTPASVESLLINDVAQHFSDLYRPSGVRVLIAGDFEIDGLQPLLVESLAEWSGLASGSERHAFEVPKAASLQDGPQVVIIDRPGATQSVVRFMLPAPAYRAPGRVAREVVTTILGGTYTSRLNANLRIDKGITYGASAALVHLPPMAYLLASAQVQTEFTGLGVKEFTREFERMQSGDFTEAELLKAQRAHRTALIEELGTLASLLGAAQSMGSFGRTLVEKADDLRTAQELTVADLNHAALSLSQPDGAVLVLVGDKAEIEQQLQSLE